MAFTITAPTGILTVTQTRVLAFTITTSNEVVTVKSTNSSATLSK